MGYAEKYFSLLSDVDEKRLKREVFHYFNLSPPFDEGVMKLVLSKPSVFSKRSLVVAKAKYLDAQQKSSLIASKIFRFGALPPSSLLCLDKDVRSRKGPEWFESFLDEFMKEIMLAQGVSIKSIDFYDSKGKKTPAALARAQNKFLNAVPQLNSEVLSYEDADPLVWKALARISAEYDCFKLSGLFRSYYKESMCQRYHCFHNVSELSEPEKKEYLNLFAEDGDAENFNRLVELGYQGELPRYGLSFFPYFPGSSFCKRVLERDWDSLSDRSRDILKGKKVAIIGPLTPTEDALKELADFDVIFLFNYFGVASWVDGVNPSACKISMYNRDDSARVGGVKDRSFLNQLEVVFALGREVRKNEWLSELGDKLSVIFNSYSLWGNPYLVGVPNAVQRAVIELARYRPERIKVFNANLFIDDSYEPDYAKRRRKYRYLGTHDLLSNFNFLKRSWESGFVEVDSGLEKVLSMSGEEYLSVMDQRFGAFA